ncbi:MULTISPECIES: hypothetical protein [Streptomyces]|uniref:Uncharacterized protein n=1 Tax=Streptomyces griseofuscus TaxID=146922 RepID=A0A7H1Q314_9ACTN|nr:hypothetical protein [Streptomyces griseofuscus]QNT94694.1 hypothetical protein HEP81_04417 [Streptomyces griseofuscus]BBC95423.1 hypothetical protein SRO_4247 [Streptomyces rochei]
MSTFLTATAFLVLAAVAAYVIHRLGLQHADRIAAYGTAPPGPVAAAMARPSRTPHHGSGRPTAQPTTHPARGDASPGPDAGSGIPEDPSI